MTVYLMRRQFSSRLERSARRKIQVLPKCRRIYESTLEDVSGHIERLIFMNWQVLLYDVDYVCRCRRTGISLTGTYSGVIWSVRFCYIYIYMEERKTMD